MGIMIAKEGFGGRANAKPLCQFFASAMGNPCHFGSKSLYMIFLLLEQAFRNKHRHINIFMSGCFKTGIQILLNVFPNCITVRFKHHAASHTGIIYQFRFFYDVGVPLCEVFLHGSDRLNHFLLICHLIQSPFLSTNQFDS